MAGASNPATMAPPELTVSRLIDAPPALVFLAWTHQEHAAHWWGPQGFTLVSCRLDARPGGSYRVAMRSPAGTVHTKVGTYRDVVAPERLAFTYAWEADDGQIGDEMFVTVTLQPQGDRTLLTVHQTGFDSIPERDSHCSGWTGCLQRFVEFAAALAAHAAPGHLSVEDA